MNEKVLLLIGVTTLCMLTPGPDMLLVMRSTLTNDRWCGSLTALGVLTGNLVHIGYCTLGIALLLSRSPIAYNVLRVASAIYLVYLGIQGLRRRHTTEASPETVTDGRHRSAYGQGLINNVLNPKGSLFYLGVFSQLITPDLSRSATLVLVMVMITVSAAFWIVFIQTLHLPAIRTWLDESKGVMERLFGVGLILFGARIAILK